MTGAAPSRYTLKEHALDEVFGGTYPEKSPRTANEKNHDSEVLRQRGFILRFYNSIIIRFDNLEIFKLLQVQYNIYRSL